MSARRVSVTTSRPAPAEFEAVYQRLMADGATGIVSVHLSSKLSGTYDAAVLAAASSATRSRSSTGGRPEWAWASRRSRPPRRLAGEDLAGVRAAALSAPLIVTTVLFYVDTLEFLRRGGRIGAASALLGTALSVKPILHFADGGIVVRDKVRTASRALAKMIDLAVAAAGDAPVDIAIHHLGTPMRAAEIEAVLDGTAR